MPQRAEIAIYGDNDRGKGGFTAVIALDDGRGFHISGGSLQTTAEAVPVPEAAEAGPDGSALAQPLDTIGRPRSICKGPGASVRNTTAARRSPPYRMPSAGWKGRFPTWSGQFRPCNCWSTPRIKTKTRRASHERGTNPNRPPDAGRTADRAGQRATGTGAEGILRPSVRAGAGHGVLSGGRVPRHLPDHDGSQSAQPRAQG